MLQSISNILKIVILQALVNKTSGVYDYIVYLPEISVTSSSATPAFTITVRLLPETSYNIYLEIFISEDTDPNLNTVILVKYILYICF